MQYIFNSPNILLNTLNHSTTMDSIQHTTRLRSIMEASADKLTLHIPRQTSDTKETFSPNIFAKRWTNYDTPSLGGSLCDLEGCSSATTLYRRDSYLNSLASTNDGSRFNLDVKSLTRNQSLETDAVTPEDGGLRFCMSPEKPCSAQLFDYTGRDFDVCSEILENSEEEAVNQSLDISRDLLEEVHESQSALEEPVVAEPVVQQISPAFRKDGVNAKNSKEYTIESRTISYKNNTRYSPLYADEPLPSSGRCSFSVRVDQCNKANAKLYIGIAESHLQGQPLGYKPGFYFVSAFSRESYLNGLKIVDTNLLPKQGEIVTVTVDMDLGWISFQSEKGIMAEGKINLKKEKTQEFYICIALGENGGAVTFI